VASAHLASDHQLGDALAISFVGTLSCSLAAMVNEVYIVTLPLKNYQSCASSRILTPRNSASDRQTASSFS